MMFWLTADQHFNHRSTLEKFIFRKFASVEQMNQTIIDRHNSRVAPMHTVFHLGDFRMTNEGPNTIELIKMLNGNHVFISGNHDRNNKTNSPIRYIVIESYGQKIIMCHRPELADELASTLNIPLACVGHVHDKWKFRKGRYCDMINVGVDQWDYYPISMKQILKAYSTWSRSGYEI